MKKHMESLAHLILQSIFNVKMCKLNFKMKKKMRFLFTFEHLWKPVRDENRVKKVSIRYVILIDQVFMTY
jgi:hypothetical protein